MQTAVAIYKVILVYILMASLLAVIDTQTFAGFTTSASVEGISISIAQPFAGTSALAAIESPLTNQDILDLTYQTEGENPAYVQLCYSHELQPWICPNDSLYQSNSGNFQISPPSGDGFYLFDTISHRNQEIFEVKDLSIPSNPLATTHLAVQVDRQPPYTIVENLSNSEPTSIPLLPSSQILYSNQSFTLPPILPNSNSIISVTFNYQTDGFSPQSYFSLKFNNSESEKTILRLGNTSLNSQFQTSIRTIYVPVTNFPGQSISLTFSLTDPPNVSSRLDLFNILYFPDGLSLPNGSSLEYLASDLDSHIFSTTELPKLDLGANYLNFFSVDAAQNQENENSLPINILP